MVLENMKDPMGQAMLDHWRGEKDGIINVYTNLGVNEHIPVPYLFRDYDAMPELEIHAIEYASGHVLDVGAGAGSHALLMQQAGMKVTAIDVSPGAVQVMKERGVLDARLQDIYQMEGERFDTVLLLMNGIGIAGDLEGLDIFLKKLCDLLKPGGQILLESTDVVYMYADEHDATLIDLSAGYYGVINYQMEYQHLLGHKFDWLYIDVTSLKTHAEPFGLACDLLYETDEYSYLARLYMAD